MQIKTKALVLNSIRYKENSLIVKCYTLSDGLKSFIVRDAYFSKKNAQKKAYFQPLTLLEIAYNFKNTAQLHYFKEIKLAYFFQSINSHIYKSAMVMFLSEILNFSIHEEEKNEDLFVFIETALVWFDQHHDFSNFHLIFLLELSKFFGFYPDISEMEYPYFELTAGTFSPFQAISSLSLHETLLFKKLVLLKFDHDTKVFHHLERQQLLKILVHYYAIHLEGFRKPKSLEVLKQIFE
ncbi:DNA repair protein RecO [Flavobacterium branchiophilum]|uniref:DNA repair protein RecO n=2 Tax=Flavobacterium branchiophilum TaxID=55197 RepID=G2Z519_FLABF|nr:DNA repair protein RecO [Flavobacterium branchiophilum]PDS22970.1 DNA repair protein RecO [Flavobacterium branchiophilum]CCB70744.1 DNA repair protein RecO [Flavobacterium branchiophilum FL-15]